MITENSTRFDGAWPSVFRRGVTALERRGVLRAAAEDAVQEAGTRAIAGDVPFRDSEDLLRWVQTVAWRVVLDSHKQDRRLVYEVPDDASGEDVGRAVEQRLRLQRLHALWRELTPDERATLTTSAGEVDRRASVRLAVRRHRVRLKLLAMLDGAAALLAAVRKAVGAERARRVGAVAAPALVVMTMFTTASLVHSDRTDSPAVDRVEARAGEHSPHKAPSASLATPHAPRPPAARPDPGSDPVSLPTLNVPYARPGGNGQVSGRPKEPDDHFVCLALKGIPSRCADLPIRITE